MYDTTVHCLTLHGGIVSYYTYWNKVWLDFTLTFGNVSLEELAGLALPGGAGTLGGNFRPLDYSAVLSLLQLARG